MQRRHVPRTTSQMAIYRESRGNPQRERQSLKSWLGSIKELLDNDSLRELLIYIYTYKFPVEEAVRVLNKEDEEWQCAVSAKLRTFTTNDEETVPD